MNTESTQWKQQNSKNTTNLALWSAIWVLSTALASFGPKYLWDFNPIITAIALLASTMIGLGMILSNRKHLRNLDEMQQKIQTDAMAITLGLGLIVGSSYSIMENVKLIDFQPEIPHLIIFMGLTYLISIIIAGAKYR